MEAERVKTAGRAGDWTRRDLLVRAGAGVAGAAAVSLGGPAPLAVAAPLAQAAGGNTLRLNAGAEPDNIDPQKASFTNEIDVIGRVFRNLLQLDANGRVVPDQAQDLPAVSDDGTTLTFTLRPGLVYSDGVPLRAANFEYAWKRHLDPAVAGEYAFTGYAIAGGEEYATADPKKLTPDQLQALRDAVGVKALDNTTLQFILKAPAAWFLTVLATPWNGVPTRQDLIASGNGGNETDSKWTEPATFVGNGPYILSEWEHQNRMHFKANPRYVFGAPPIADVEYAMINEPAVAFAAYLNDELDVTGVQAEDRPRVESDPVLSTQFQQFPGSCTNYLAMNLTKPPFDNIKVRQAFSLALDRTGYVRNILGGAGIPARQFLPPGFPGYYETELEEQIYNPDLAKQRLAEAGFAGGKGLPEIKLSYPSSARAKTRAEAQADIFKQNLGVTIQPDPVESRALVALRKSTKDYPQMVLGGWCQDYPDPQDWYSTVFNSRATVEHGGWKNAEFDRLTDAADVESDPGRRSDLYRQAAQILINEVPVIFFYYSVGWRLIKPRLLGLNPDPTEFFLGEHNLYNMTLNG